MSCKQDGKLRVDVFALKSKLAANVTFGGDSARVMKLTFHRSEHTVLKYWNNNQSCQTFI